jgi:pyruvate-formate lyase-activating enzyme
MNKYYCSQKFWWLSIDLQRMETMSCSAATPQKIDHERLKGNFTNIFNTEQLQQERQQMLAGKKVQSCSATCWRAEEAGLPSRRTIMNSNTITHTDVNSTPEVLHIILGNQCNMTCSYCCKQYSSAWYKDIKQNGTYNIKSHDDRFKINSKDELLARVGQKKMNERNNLQFIIEELQKTLKTKNVSELQITGGEPFLHVILNDILDKFQMSKKINIFTGLGINTARFEAEIIKLKKYKNNITLTISAENTKNFYEFNRAGNSWKQFKENIECLKQNKINYKFSSVLSNLTIFGLEEFEEFAKGHTTDYHVCSDPDFLSMHVLDKESKKNIIKKISQITSPAKKIIIQTIDKEPTAIQHKNFSNYIKEFAKRRNKNLLIFPKTLLNWLESNK